MKIFDEKFGNQYNLSKLAKSLSILESKKGFEIALPDREEVNDFYKITIKDKYDQRCPFSIWVEDKAGTKLFFNLGLSKCNATVYHNFDISSEEGIDDIVEFIESFLHSSIIETTIYCQNRIKRVNYKILTQRNTPAFSALCESYFICLNRRVESKTYSKWME